MSAGGCTGCAYIATHVCPGSSGLGYIELFSVTNCLPPALVITVSTLASPIPACAEFADGAFCFGLLVTLHSHPAIAPVALHTAAAQDEASA